MQTNRSKTKSCDFFGAGSKQQEAQQSQRDGAMLGVIEYFAKSLKVIRNGILEKGVNPY